MLNLPAWQKVDFLFHDRGKIYQFFGGLEKDFLGVKMRVMKRERVDILGVKIDKVSFDEAVGRVGEMIKRGGKHLVVTPYSESVVKAQSDFEFKTILNGADLAVSDGISLVWVSQFLGKPLRGRIPGTDLMVALCSQAAKKGYRIFLLGGRERVAERTAECLKSRFQGLKAGYFEGSPKVKKETKKQLNATIDKINQFAPDILFVAYGPVAQEKWLAQNLGKLKVKVAMGVGGAFDYLSGQVPRAPKILRNLGLEWLFRLVRQPWRIKRQTVLVKFVWLVLKEKLL